MQVFLTGDYLAIALEFATDGELFDRVKEANRFNEGMARFFFQQLIAGVGCFNPCTAVCRTVIVAARPYTRVYTLIGVTIMRHAYMA